MSNKRLRRTKRCRVIILSAGELSLPRVLRAVPRRIGDWVLLPVVYGWGSDRLGSGFPHVRFVRLTSHRGIGATVRRGFRDALALKVDAIVKLDGDGQSDPSLLPKMLRALDRGASLVQVSRFQHPLSEFLPIDREVLYSMITTVVNLLTDWELTDASNGYFGCSARLVRILVSSMKTDGYGLPLELLLRSAAHGYTVHELGQHPNYRHGNPKFARIYSKRMLATRCERAGVYLRVISKTLASLGYGKRNAPFPPLHRRLRMFRTKRARYKASHRA